MKKGIIILSLLILIQTIINADIKSYKNLYIEELQKRNIENSGIVIEKKAKTYDKFTSYIVSYKAEGLKIYALLNIPNGKKEKYPVIIVNHGYIPPNQYSTLNSYRLVTTYYANNGFLVIKPDYRGHDKSEIKDDSYLNRLSYPVDVLFLLNSLSAIKKADLNNIFVYGHSMGGGITLAVLETFKNIKAASLWAPVTKPFPESTLYFRRKRNEETARRLKKEWDKMFNSTDYYKLSPINYVKDIKVPIILHHGRQDDSVPYSWSESLVLEFKKHKTNFVFYSYNDDHNFAKKYFYTVLRRDVEFFKKYISE